MKNMLKSGLILGLLVLGANSLKADVDLYIYDTSYHLGVVDLTTDQVSVIGTTNVPYLYDIGFTSNGNLYGTTASALYKLSLTNGAPSLISNYPAGFGGVSGTNGLTALVGDGTNLLAASSTTANLYAIDVSPFATSTLTGATIPSDSEGDLTFGPAGTTGPLYDALKNGNLEKLTIAGTTITSVSVVGKMEVGSTPVSGITGLATIGNTTYAVAGTEVYTISLTTGALTPVFNYSGHGLGNVAGAAALSVPEPGNVAMLLAGVVALAFYQARKRARA